MNTTFTKHASIRLAERTALSPTEIKNFIHKGLTVPLGAEKKKVHHLVYSKIDDDYFIVVVDESTAEIITVYPWTYQPNRCWYNLNSEILKMARTLAENRKIEVAPAIPTSEAPKIIPPSPKKLFEQGTHGYKKYIVWTDTEDSYYGDKFDKISTFYTASFEDFIASPESAEFLSNATARLNSKKYKKEKTFYYTINDNPEKHVYHQLTEWINKDKLVEAWRT